MVTLAIIWLNITLYLVFRQEGLIVGASMFGIFSKIKGKYGMITQYFVPLLKKILKNRYGAIIYQICQLTGASMAVLGLTSILKFLAGNNNVDIGAGVVLVAIGMALFFMVLLIDDKITQLDTKWENRFKNINAK